MLWATTAKLLVFKLVMGASKTWRRLKGENQLPKVVAGILFRDGTEVTASPDHRAARPPPPPNFCITLSTSQENG